MSNDPFVDVAALISIGPIQYLDTRDQATFDAGHVPGALHVPVEEWDKAAKAADIGFANTAYWDEALGSLGVDHSTTAVAYDDGRMTNAARVWFILQSLGVKAVILNGGWPVLSSATGLPPVEPSRSGFRAVSGAGSVGLVDRETLKRQLDGNSHVFDTRTRAEFTGEDMRNRPRGGHLPGARHLWHTDLLDNGVVRPAPVLRAHDGASGCQPCRSHRDPLRRGRKSGLGRSRSGSSRIRRRPRLLPQLRGLGTR